MALSDTEQPYDAAQVYPEAGEGALAVYREMLTADGKLLLNFGCFLIRADGRTVLGRFVRVDGRRVWQAV